MNMINVMGATNGVVLYNGNSVTCYPGSNQSDTGKLQLEFNMSRFVTRVSSKNFCVTNPSFVITTRQSTVTGIQQLVVSAGQASINGMDLIITDSIAVNPPEQTGTFYLALRLQRSDDQGALIGTGNVLGDLVVGADVIFQGVCLTYYDTKEANVDMLYLAKITWDGDNFTSVIEDEDKYGRIWAEDILCKIDDPKHPDITRLLLQDWIYKVPDWYVSKEGDTEFGAIEWFPGRQNEKYKSSDYGTGKYSIKVQAVSDTSSEITVKAAESTDENYGPGRVKIITQEGSEYSTVNGYIGNTLLRSLSHSVDSGSTKVTFENFIVGNYGKSIDDKMSIGMVALESNSIYSAADGIIEDYIAEMDPAMHEIVDLKMKQQLGENRWYVQKMSGHTPVLGLEAKWISDSDFEFQIGKAPFRYLSDTGYLYLNKLPNSGSATTVNKFVIKPPVQIADNLDVSGNVTVTGEVIAAKVWNAVYNDYAEYFKKPKDEIIEPMDLVCIGEDGLVYKVKTEEDVERLIGVCSDTAGMILGGKDLAEDERVVVGLLGKLFVKADEDIKAGEYVQATSRNTVRKTLIKRDRIGIALTDSKDRKVLIFYS